MDPKPALTAPKGGPALPAPGALPTPGALPAPGAPSMGAPPPGGPAMPGPMGTPPGSVSNKPSPNTGTEKEKRPSIIFMIFDFLVFGGAVAALILLFITN